MFWVYFLLYTRTIPKTKKENKHNAFLQKIVDVKGIPALQFAPPPQALQVNTTDNVGFCMEIEKWVNWTGCIKETDDPEILNLDSCFSDPEYLSTCWDGTWNITK